MKRKYRSPIIMDVTPIETENGISIIFGNSQETFGSDYTFNIDAWENWGAVLLNYYGDEELFSILPDMDLNDDLRIDDNELTEWVMAHPEILE